MKQLLQKTTVLAAIVLIVSCAVYGQSIKKDKDRDQTIKTTNMKKTKPLETAELMQKFNNVFLQHDPSALPELIAPDCVMESIQGPNGVRYEGYDACLAFWQELATDPNTHFDCEEIFVLGDRATIRWRYWWGEGESNSVRGVNLMRVKDGLIIEALGYSKRQ